MAKIKNILIYILVIIILITTNIYFVTSYKKVAAQRDQALAENKTLQESIKNPKIVYKKTVEQGKVTIIERELIKITTQYVMMTTSSTVKGTPYGTKYKEQPRPWWEEYDFAIDPNTLPDDWELKDGVLIYKEKTTIKEPKKTETNKTEGPMTITDIRVSTNTVILIEKENLQWNVMSAIDSGGTFTIGAGRNFGPLTLDLLINTDKEIGIMGLWRFNLKRK